MGSSGPPLLQQVDIVELGGFASPGLPYLVVHLSHPLDHLVWPLPLGQEFAFRGWYQDQDQVPGPKYAQLGSPVVDPCLGLLGLSEMVPDDGPDLRHVAPHLLYMVHHGAIWGGLPPTPLWRGRGVPLVSHRTIKKKHVEAWGILRTAKRKRGRSWSQFLPSVSMAFLSICLSVLMNCSTSLTVWGWYTEVRCCFTWRRLRSSFNTRDMKQDPLSVSNSLAIPTRMNRSMSSLATA